MSLVATKSIDMPTPSVPFSKSTSPSSQKALWFGGVRVGPPHPHVRRMPAPVVDKRRRRRVQAKDHRGDFVTEAAVRYQIRPRRAYSAVRFGASGMSARKSRTTKTLKTTTRNRHDGNGRGGGVGRRIRMPRRRRAWVSCRWASTISAGGPSPTFPSRRRRRRRRHRHSPKHSRSDGQRNPHVQHLVLKAGTCRFRPVRFHEGKIV